MFLCFFGDSLTLGTNDSQYRGWPGRALEEARSRGAALDAYNLGIRSNTTDDILERWAEEAGRRFPSEGDRRLVFCFGAADASAPQGTVRVPAERSIENARKILHVAGQAFPTLFVTPPPVADPDFTARIGELVGPFLAVCRDVGVPALDIFHPLAANTAYLDDIRAGDGVHPGATGYDILAELFRGWDSWQVWTRDAQS